MKGFFALVAFLVAATLGLSAEASAPPAAPAPLTLEEARAYVARFPEAAALDVVALTAIEAAVPEATLPAGLLVLAGDEVGWAWAGPLELRVAGRLAYAIELPAASARAPRPPWWKYFAIGWTGLAAGWVVGWIAGASR
jgi:hypothetical protein